MRLKFGSRAFWLRQMRQWHWISAAICLIGTLLFAVTGITLNHASRIEARLVVVAAGGRVPTALLQELQAQPAGKKTTVPAALSDWLQQTMSIRAAGVEAELSPQEMYIALPRPGGDAWLTVDLKTGDVQYERTDRGWISYLNDLHKGRHAGIAWSLFLDVFAVGCVVFCVTGLLLLQMLAVGRPSTWPLVALGLAVPVLIAVFLIH